jgi:hypothetical protein
MKNLLVAILFAIFAAVSAGTQTPRATQETYTPPRTPWGDPDLQGTFTNKDENGIPMERPSQRAGISTT